MFKRSAAFAVVCVPVWLMCCCTLTPPGAKLPPSPATRPAVDEELPPVSAGVWTAVAAVACFAEPVRRRLADEPPPWRPPVI